MPDDAKAKNLLERAQQLFKQYYVSCFWHLKADMVVTEAMLPVIIKGLRAHGGRAAFLEADFLERERK
jgi:hypothetical protein